MEKRYTAHFYAGGDIQSYTLYSSTDLIQLSAKASIFIEGYANAYCEIWDAAKEKLVSKVKRVPFD